MCSKTIISVNCFYLFLYLGLPVILLGLLDKIIGLLQGIIFYGLAFIAFSMVIGFLKNSGMHITLDYHYVENYFGMMLAHGIQ